MKSQKNITFVSILSNNVNDDKAWEHFINNDELKKWINLKIEFDDIKTKTDYYISSFPTFFLIDENGIIIEKPTNSNDVLKKIN